MGMIDERSSWSFELLRELCRSESHFIGILACPMNLSHDSHDDERTLQIFCQLHSVGAKNEDDELLGLSKTFSAPPTAQISR